MYVLCIHCIICMICMLRLTHLNNVGTEVHVRKPLAEASETWRLTDGTAHKAANSTFAMLIQPSKSLGKLW